MIVLLSALAGAILGAATARRHKGNTADMAQYAAGYAILFALMGLIATIVLEKALV